MRLQRVTGFGWILAQNLAYQCFAIHRTTTRAKEELENLRFLLAQPNTSVLDRIVQQPLGGLELIWPNGENSFLAAVEFAQLGAYPCEQFIDAERLANVVIGTRFQTTNGIRLGARAGQH